MSISIITATYNSEEYVLETYESIKNQTNTDWEWIVTDDCSTDGTWSALLSIASQDSKVRVFRNEVNSGAAIARNNSLDHIKGDYIAFIDSDDLWEPTKLATQIKFMRDTNTKFSFTGYQLIDNEGILLGKTVDTTNSDSFSYSDMLAKKATLGCSTVILSRDALGDFRMPNLRTGQDYAFWLRILKSGQRACLLHSPLTKYRISNNSISKNKVKKAFRQWEIYREHENIPFLLSCYYFVFYAYRAVFRRT